MAFFAYILHCRGGIFYTGHTDNLEQRVAAHMSGLIPGFTADLMPVKLVWSQDFSTRYEAISAERQIKGWSKAKKLALIRGDWALISHLAKKHDGPSTSSGRTGGGEVEVLRLHPDQIASLNSDFQVQAKVLRMKQKIRLRFELTGAIDKIFLPQRDFPLRTDGLWQTTCFEMFVQRPGGKAYIEYNFSPSTRWAAYGFSNYRDGMFELQSHPPDIELTTQDEALILKVDIELPEKCLNEMIQIGLSAVIHERGDIFSYWALKHPPGKPDFHHKDCFALKLAPPDAA